MALVKITAVIRREMLEAVETRLRQAGVPGITVSTVKGFGEYANFFSHDWMVTHARMEVFVIESESPAIVGSICDAARTGVAGDGFVAVLPVQRLVRIRSGEETNGRAATTDASAVVARAVESPVRGASFLAWLLVALGVGAGACVVFVASRHQMHFLAAVLAIILVLCGILGGLAFLQRKEPVRHDHES